MRVCLCGLWGWVCGAVGVGSVGVCVCVCSGFGSWCLLALAWPWPRAASAVRRARLVDTLTVVLADEVEVLVHGVPVGIQPRTAPAPSGASVRGR